ncbi:bifunctional tetrahydrofolate synthase/dihydrofolate synthase [Ideonella sp. A 288]|uniref:bifunctional tetrahydrofolate synthase/dihydrofolate synthase n=1 Tax=Ideonella sp. A 288 TaxID=1962181 RepID=UPI000B4B7F1D|nr:bifunctional tetrahydrofolate synthase/dihydrofolate synthase [Ideonella sp. A 288]
MPSPDPAPAPAAPQRPAAIDDNRGAGGPGRRTLADWLAHCEHLHPKTIDMTLDRVVAVRDRLGLHFDAPVISVAGTNGKGSTCAMLECVALQSGYRVGLYIKPHLVHFEERCRINGEMVDADALLPHFEAVEAARQGVTLTYFEFTTLAILRALAAVPLDLVILEVGLGGRLDAVNAIDADCAVITSIALDHTEYLGPDRESIGREKAGIIRGGRPVIVSDPQPPASVLRRAEELGADLWCLGRDFNVQGDKQQWSWTGRGRRFSGLAYPALRGANQLLNAGGALAALEALRDRVPVTAQGVRNGLAMVELPGRFQIVPGQPTLVLDVAHNPQSVAALALNLDEMGFFPRTHAVFGAMRDKDLAGLLPHLMPLVDHWHLTSLPAARAATADELQAAVRAAGLRPGVTLQCHADPREALLAALGSADPADRIIVFGSFYTVGGVLKDGLPRLVAKHLG